MSGDTIPIRDFVWEHRLDDEKIKRERIVRWACQLTHAVQSLHMAGICHGDIKPDNLVVDANEHFNLILIDFGVASRCKSTADVKFSPNIEKTAWQNGDKLNGRLMNDKSNDVNRKSKDVSHKSNEKSNEKSNDKPPNDKPPNEKSNDKPPNDKPPNDKPPNDKPPDDIAQYDIAQDHRTSSIVSVTDAYSGPVKEYSFRDDWYGVIWTIFSLSKGVELYELSLVIDKSKYFSEAFSLFDSIHKSITSL